MSRSTTTWSWVVLAATIAGCHSPGRFAGRQPREAEAVQADSLVHEANPPRLTARPTMQGSIQPVSQEQLSDQTLPAPVSESTQADGPMAIADDIGPQVRVGRYIPLPWNLADDLPGLMESTQEPLGLDDIKASVIESYPALRAAILQGQVAAGQKLAALGEFDLKLKADSISGPLGFYRTYRHLVKAEQASWGGGNLYSQYRIGDGNFQPWYGERETNEGGEFKMGGELPLLRGRAIDERRAAVFQASLQEQAVEPQVRSQTIEFVQFASRTYWDWVAAGQMYRVHQQLYELTRDRNAGIARRVELQDLARLELKQNERLIASRQAKLVEAERKLQQSAIKLSLFLRDQDGQPLLPSPASLPVAFPPLQPPDKNQLEADLALAIESRPEFWELALQRQQAQVDLQTAQNQLLPGLSAGLEASKDVGAAASSKKDKTPFELEAGLLFELPVQRRKARGKLMAIEAKLAQIAAKRELVTNKLRAEMQDVYSALHTALARWEQLHRGTQLARELETAERRKFDLGDSDLIRVALQEQAALEAALTETEAQADFFRAVADYQAALAAP